MRGGNFVPLVVGFVARHPSLSRILFNRVFKTGKVPREHNSLLAEAVRTTRPGKASDVTVGQGRSAVFLAQRGWDVGFDVSEEALSRAGEAARRSGVSIHAVQSTSEALDYGADHWDLLLLFYAWAPVSDPAFAARLKQSLGNGGLVVFEHSLHDGPDAAPKAAGAPDPAELPKLFTGFEILCYEEVKGVPDWREAPGGELPRPVRMMQGSLQATNESLSPPCPPARRHIKPVACLGRELRARGHRVTTPHSSTIHLDGLSSRTMARPVVPHTAFGAVHPALSRSIYRPLLSPRRRPSVCITRDSDIGLEFLRRRCCLPKSPRGR